MLFLWGVTMVLGDSLQTEEETALAGVCWTCIPQQERDNFLYNLKSIFRGFVFKHKLFHPPLSLIKWDEETHNNALRVTLMYKASKNPAFDAKEVTKLFLPDPLNWYFGRMLQLRFFLNLQLE